MAEKNKYARLLKNSQIFAVAQFSGKVLQFLIVPFYTYVLTTEEYGTVDTLTTTVRLLLPLLLLSIHDAALRFAMDKNNTKKTVFTNCFFVFGISSSIFLLSYFVFIYISIFDGLWGMFYLILLAEGINNLLANFARGIERVVQFALNGVIQIVLLVSLNVWFLLGLEMGVKGYLLAILISYTISNIYLFIAIHGLQYIDFKSIDYALIKKMLIFSMPLIPTAVMWWIMNASDRYIITAFLGVGATGIFAVSHKIPTVINMCYQIFLQAWQMSAIEEISSDGRNEFFSNVYKVVVQFLFVIASLILVVVKPVSVFLFSIEYKMAWKYTPFLIVASIFSSYAGFLGTNYVASTKTAGAFKTSFFSACLNLVLNIILTPLLGMNGTAIATMISFFILWIIRVRDTKKFICISYNIKNIVMNILVITVQIAILLSQIPGYFIYLIILWIVILVINKKIIGEMFYWVYKLTVKRLHKK